MHAVDFRSFLLKGAETAANPDVPGPIPQPGRRIDGLCRLVVKDRKSRLDPSRGKSANLGEAALAGLKAADGRRKR
jgi:hypothetical protein